MKKMNFKQSCALLRCGAMAMAFVAAMAVPAGAQTLGTAVGNDVNIYAQSTGDKAAPDAEPTGTISYRVVEVNGFLFAKVVSPIAEFEGADWAVQLRDFGVDGNTKTERNLAARSEDKLTAYNTAAYEYLTNGGTTRQMQIFCAPLGLGYSVTELFAFEQGKINNPVEGDVTAPALGDVTYKVEDENCIISLPAMGEDDYFYYISDADNNLHLVSFYGGDVTLAVKKSSKYNISVEAIDYNGNRSAAKTFEFETEFDTTANLALNCAATASSGTASAGNDGNEGTRWESAATDTEWWQVDLPAAYNLTNIEIKWEGAYSKHFYIETSIDGDVWAQKEIAYDGGNGLLQNIAMAGVSAKYVRFQGIERATGYGNSFWEFRVYASGFYDLTATDELKDVLLSPTEASVYSGETATFTATAISAKGTVLSDVVWAIDSYTEGCTVTDKGNGAYEVTAATAGTYKVVISATSEGIKVTNDFVLTVNETPVLTTLTLATTLTNIGVAGRALELTYTAKDQYNNDIVITPEYTVTGTAGGRVEGNNYIADAVGTASITLTVGGITSAPVEVEIVAEGANLALGKTVTANDGATDIEKAVDGDYGSLAILSGSNDEREYNTFLMVDLAPEEPIISYNLKLVEVEWEGATAADYTLEVSLDGIDWTVINTIVDGEGMTARHDVWTPAVSRAVTTSEFVRYVRINATKAATQYGVKVRELRVYGTNNYPSSVETLTAADARLFVVGNMLQATGDVRGIEVYNLQGALVATATTTLDVTHLAAGVYVARATTADGETIATKFVCK